MLLTFVMIFWSCWNT